MGGCFGKPVAWINRVTKNGGKPLTSPPTWCARPSNGQYCHPCLGAAAISRQHAGLAPSRQPGRGAPAIGGRHPRQGRRCGVACRLLVPLRQSEAVGLTPMGSLSPDAARALEDYVRVRSRSTRTSSSELASHQSLPFPSERIGRLSGSPSV
jgi:hypothetical protein